MAEFLQFFERPNLKNPYFIAAWPGMGNIAITAVNYLKDKLGAVPLGEFEAGEFFAPTGATVTKQVINSPEIPRNQFYYCKSANFPNDLLFYIGSAQPVPHMEYKFAVEILKIAKAFNVGTVYTAAAAPSDMDYRDTPRVFAVPNRNELLKKMMEYKVHFMGEGNIAGLNGLLVSVAGEMDIPGVCLLGEIPFFTAQIEFPKAALEVLEILTKLLKIKIDMVDLELHVSQKEKEIAPLAALLSKNTVEKEALEEEKIVPETDTKAPKAVLLKIEKLFRQAEFDGNYKSKMLLKEELDKWGLFEEYLDRFLDLFKKV